MDRVYEDSKRMLEREVQEITQKGAVSVEDIAMMSKLLDNLKDISIICAMEEEGYSERMMYDSDASYASYARGRGSQANRDSMGRYSSRGYNYGSYDGGGSYRDGGSSYRGSYAGYDMRQSERR